MSLKVAIGSYGMWNTSLSNYKEGRDMFPIKISELHAFEFDNGQDLLGGPVGTWFVAPEDQIIPAEFNPGREKVVFVRSQSCGPGWYQPHPKGEIP